MLSMSSQGELRCALLGLLPDHRLRGLRGVMFSSADGANSHIPVLGETGHSSATAKHKLRH